MSAISNQPERIIGHRIEGKAAWIRQDLQQRNWLVELPLSALAEIEQAVQHLRKQPVPLLALRPESFDMPACAEAMAEVRRILNHGVRFSLVRGLPIDSLSDDEARAIYWILASMVGRPVAQKLDGTMIYDVEDTGAKALPGSGVRPDKTNIDLKFHNDNAYNKNMPEVVGLLCIRKALQGGTSRVMSFATVHNALIERSPEHLGRLYQDFVFDRQKEFSPGEPATFSAPMFVNQDGVLSARLGLHQVRNGYAMIGSMDEPTRQAIEAIELVFSDSTLQFEFEMEPGDFQFAKNREIGHSRTEFTDSSEAEKKRLLVRLWLRNAGPQGYVGDIS